MIDGLHSTSLISLVQHYDNDCIAILDKNEINILKYSKLILKGHGNKADGLWDTPISRPLIHRSHTSITRYRTKTELIQYLHGLCFIYTPRTFLKTIKNRKFLTWPVLDNQQRFKHILPSIATALGNMDQDRKNLQ